MRVRARQRGQCECKKSCESQEIGERTKAELKRISLVAIAIAQLSPAGILVYYSQHTPPFTCLTLQQSQLSAREMHTQLSHRRTVTIKGDLFGDLM